MMEKATTYSRHGLRILLAAMLAVFALVAAYTIIPAQKAWAETGTITVQYTASETGKAIEGLQVNAYRIASIEEDNFVLTGNFSYLGSKLGWSDGKTAVTSDSAWLSQQAETMDGEIRAGGPLPDATGVTDASGSTVLSGIEEGLILLLPVGDGVHEFTSMLVQLDNSVNFALTVEPKFEKPDKPRHEIKVVKHWAGDAGFEANRPQSIKVQLVCDNATYGDPVELNDANGWTYAWTIELEDDTVHQWNVIELEAPEGYAVSIAKTEDGFAVTNTMKPTDVVISKQEVGGGAELPGATLIVEDLAGNKIDEWVSGEKPHKISLKPGMYSLTEITAPEGFEIAETIHFRVNANNTTDVLQNGEWVDAQNHIVMFDAPKPPPNFGPPPSTHEVTISKQEVGGGAELPGATLVVRDENGKVVAQWVSTTEPHKITLEPGTYTLTEITAPEGFEIAETITFRVNEDGTAEVLQNGKWVDCANHVVMFDARTPGVPPATPRVTGKLPQTGQLWWPVPVLFCAGLIAIGLGRIVSARSRA